ncbi:short-chain dehydrogenase reductase [Colletotrichum plurivorum]|uniref:Short-chain dehydrogenase reductase n=1 Tax=Colletotrichum plurivorum TaxID=2175906 RepID=A0A8H6NEE7_9PEZI|nr:short-chain dehydrogenase reductase [Colletotrichum plurivorum]
MAGATTFDISPEKRASMSAFMKRQIFSEPPLPSSGHADLTGNTAIVTGSNVGLGLECSRQLLGLGLGKLILAVRSESKGEEARRDLEAWARSPASGRRASQALPTIEVWHLDLSRYDSITAFAERTRNLESLHIVVHNAGLVKTALELNATTGHDEVTQVNYLSAALLTILLLPVIKDKNTPQKPGRFVIVNSDVAAWAKFKEQNSVPLLSAFDKPEFFDPQERYFTSKLLGQLFLSELVKRVPPSVAVVNAANPGLCYGSSLNRDMEGFAGTVFNIFKRTVGHSTPVGARSLTDAAVNHGLKSHGQYIEDGKIQPMAPIVYKRRGREIAALLWDETMKELAFARSAEIVQELASA